MLTTFIKLYDNVRYTFKNTDEILNQNNYIDCILMSPCIVVQKEKKYQALKDYSSSVLTRVTTKNIRTVFT